MRHPFYRCDANGILKKELPKHNRTNSFEAIAAHLGLGYLLRLSEPLARSL